MKPSDLLGRLFCVHWKEWKVIAPFAILCALLVPCSSFIPEDAKIARCRKEFRA